MTADMKEVDRLRRAFTGIFPDNAARADCPPAGRIWEGLQGELERAELRDLVDHLALCRLCAESWRLGHELANAVGARERERRRSRRAWVQGLAAAATVVLAVGLFYRDGSMLSHDRAPSGPAIESRVVGPLPRADCRLLWTELAGAWYDVDVRTADLEPVAAAKDLAVSEFLVPPEALAGLAPGDRLKVYVEAHLRDGSLAAARTLEVELE